MMDPVFVSKWIFSAAMLLASFALFGQNEVDKKHVQVGSRVASIEEHVAKLLERAKSATKNPQESGDQSSDDEQIASHGLYYTTSHLGAYHHAIRIAPIDNSFEESVELEDGSIWTINPWDVNKTANWLDTDVLVISPNHTWFSSYPFRITNQNTGKSIQVNLTLGPIYNGPSTHWIVDIDYLNGFVFLEDHTVWEMSPFDIEQWVINDTVIIGINDAWFSFSQPNILINVNMLDYAPGASSY
jgi:hypothetical protein